MSLDGQRIVSGDKDGIIIIWDSETQNHIQVRGRLALGGEQHSETQNHIQVRGRLALGGDQHSVGCSVQCSSSGLHRFGCIGGRPSWL